MIASHARLCPGEIDRVGLISQPSDPELMMAQRDLRSGVECAVLDHLSSIAAPMSLSSDMTTRELIVWVCRTLQETDNLTFLFSLLVAGGILLYIPAYFSAAKDYRQKAYFARVNLLIIIFTVMQVIVTVVWPFSQVMLIQFLLCSFGVPYSCYLPKTIPYILFNQVRVRLYPYLSGVFFYAFIGYTFTTSIFFTRLVRCTSLVQGAELTAKKRLIVPLWEHAVVWSFAVILTLIRVTASVLIELSSFVLPSPAVMVLSFLNAMFRMLVLAVVFAAEWVLFVFVVRSMRDASAGNRKRPNYTALLLSFVLPFTFYVIFLVIYVGLSLVVSVLNVVYLMSPSVLLDTVIVEVQTVAHLTYSVVSVILYLQQAVIVLSHVAMLAGASIRRRKAARREKSDVPRGMEMTTMYRSTAVNYRI
ncbi:hypothetical protein J8273_4260 [Carpediemonas membranifera]|uniref:Uncharacterized protein n=1 Tax=Carpediemonas membranifera TaxID=201153 RepID=A0A8J6B280_9EUKA|nr:hypothetical protein J8273_4260 [Carpediemonas membranifera]|eukprot:KAG9394158.1 hypothetical protein J8273_4260 [Carpediemonas membranifera]